MGSTPRSRFPRRNLVAKVGIGLAVAVGAVGVAVAPAIADSAVDDGGDQVVVSPTDEPTAEPTTEPTEVPVVEPTVAPSDDAADDSEDAVDGAADADGPPADSFGAWVSTQAHEGGVDGQAISEAAHERNDARRAAKAVATPKHPRDK